MVRRFSWRFLSLGLLAVVCLTLLVVTAPGQPPTPPSPPEAAPAAALAPDNAPEPASAPDEAPPPLSEQSFTGSDRCVQCHRPQADAWAESKHANAHSKMPAKYQNDASCLKCHITAFGQPGGYVPGGEKDLLAVGCETCHGPGALHENAALRFRFSTTTEEEEKLTKEMKATIVRIAPDTVCAACHTTTGHQQHPAYDGQPPPDFVSTSVAASPSYHLRGYNIKTCGSCHYNQYKQWGTEQHADLSAQMPAKYRSNQECLACHPNGHGVAGILTAGADPSVVGNHIDAACESCHGPGREHVRFNVRFIAYPPLGPKLEQAARQSIRTGKAANTCIQCHVSQRHQPHPEYEKENATETKS